MCVFSINDQSVVMHYITIKAHIFINLVLLVLNSKLECHISTYVFSQKNAILRKPISIIMRRENKF